MCHHVNVRATDTFNPISDAFLILSRQQYSVLINKYEQIIIILILILILLLIIIIIIITVYSPIPSKVKRR